MRPILALSRVMTDVRETGDFGRRADRESEDEIGGLVESFNEMTQKIRLASDVIALLNIRFRMDFAAMNAGRADAAVQAIFGAKEHVDKSGDRFLTICNY